MNVPLYEFSSGVKSKRNSSSEDWEFVEYEVGQFMLNSFSLSPSIKTNDRGIPEAIDKAIRNDYFTVKTEQHPNVALTGRYLEDNWVVLAVCDQLAGRANEVYRYFCVKHPLTEDTDPMLSLINWYLDRSEPRVDPNPNRENDLKNLVKINPSLAFPNLTLSDLESRVFHTLEKGDSQTIEHTNLDIKAVSNIIAKLPLEERQSFSWAINAHNFTPLVNSGKFRLVQSSKATLWVGARLKSPVKGGQDITDRELVQHKLKQLARSDSDEFNNSEISLITALFKFQISEHNWKQIFENDIGLNKLINSVNPEKDYIQLLVLRSILIPNSICEIFDFSIKSSQKLGNGNILGKVLTFGKSTNHQKMIIKFEKKILNLLIRNLSSIYHKEKASTELDLQHFTQFSSRLIDLLYEGVWNCLANTVNDINPIKFEGFLLRARDKKWQRYFRNYEGLWEFVLYSRVRIDFYNNICEKNIDYLPESAKEFFNKLKTPDSHLKKTVYKFLKDLWRNDPIILLWLHQQQEGDSIRWFEKMRMNEIEKVIKSMNYELPGEENIIVREVFFK